LEEQQHRNALPPGFELQEYQIESVLGRPGGFGVTYLATDTHLCQSVAIKEYLPIDFAVREGRSTVYVRSTAYDDSFKWGLNCFIEEARVLAKFNHPNIVRVLRFFEANGTAYMVMEYQHGQSLTDYLKKMRVLTENELLKIVSPLLEGLKEIHNAGFLHRDIKPNNIYIRDDNTPVLLDFGSARYAVGQKTRSVTSIVTPGYAPLEQYDNEISDQGPWTDIYALGAVMYCAISGDAPPAATRRVIMKDPMPPAVKIGEGKYKKNLLQAIDWALQLSEEDRPQSVDQWQEKMLASGSSLNVHRVEFSQPRWWSFFMVFSIVALILLSSTVALLWYDKQTHNNELEKQLQRHQIAENKLEKERKKEQEKRKIAEKHLVIERRHRKQAEEQLREIQALVEEIKRFEPQSIETLNFFDEKQNFYEVTNVSIGDVLNLREFPGHLNKIVQEIPRTATCIEYLGGLRNIKSQVWVKIQYQEVQGWVNSTFLIQTEHCEAQENVEKN
jgi:serine/threonine protein kinase